MTRDLTPWERLETQLIRGQYRIGREAARDIAEKITEEHGFWDFEERKRAFEAENARPVLTLLPGGNTVEHEAA